MRPERRDDYAGRGLGSEQPEGSPKGARRDARLQGRSQQEARQEYLVKRS